MYVYPPGLKTGGHGEHVWRKVFSCMLTAVLMTDAVGETYYCSGSESDIEATSEWKTLRTVYSGHTYYDNNRYCAWRLQGHGNPNYRLQLTVTSSDLQWAPDDALCSGYDSVNVYDGDSATSRHIVSWCGKQNPRSIISAGAAIYITFHSNDKNVYNYRGVTLKFRLFDLGDVPGLCPQGWVEGPPPGTYCYSLKTHEQTWAEAQKFCNYDGSNLLSLEDDQETQFILQNVSSGQHERIWLGLNDIITNGVYTWIDDVDSSKLTSSRWHHSPHNPDVYLNCVLMWADSGLWQEESCSEGPTVFKYKFICKRLKGNNTAIFQVLPEEQEEIPDPDATTSTLVWIVLGCVLVLLVLAVVIAIIALHQRNLHKRQTAQPTNRCPDSDRPPPSSQCPRPPPYEEAVAISQHNEGL